MAGYLRWHQAPPGSARYKELRQFLLDRAMEHDSPPLLFNLAARADLSDLLRRIDAHDKTGSHALAA